MPAAYFARVRQRGGTDSNSGEEGLACWTGTRLRIALVDGNETEKKGVGRGLKLATCACLELRMGLDRVRLCY